LRLRAFMAAGARPTPAALRAGDRRGGVARERSEILLMSHLVGLDLGFSERRKTNAFAIFRDGNLILPELMSPSERDAALRELAGVEVIAIDAPIVPADTPETLPRKCERAFCRGPFQKRCKPGMSHVAGTGRQLRAHGRRAAD